MNALEPGDLMPWETPAADEAPWPAEFIPAPDIHSSPAVVGGAIGGSVGESDALRTTAPRDAATPGAGANTDGVPSASPSPGGSAPAPAAASVSGGPDAGAGAPVQVSSERPVLARSTTNSGHGAEQEARR